LAIVKDVGMKIQKYKGELVSIPVCSVSKPVGALFRSHKYQQAFSTDLKNGCPKCTIGPAQMNNLQDNISKIKQFSLISSHPQDTWTPIWENT